MGKKCEHNFLEKMDIFDVNETRETFLPRYETKNITFLHHAVNI